MTQLRSRKTILVIVCGLLVGEYFFHNHYFILAAFVLGCIGIFSDFLTKQIDWFWYKIAQIMGFVTGKILLSLVFVIFVIPIAFFYKIAGKNKMINKPSGNTFWVTRNISYTKNDLENPW